METRAQTVEHVAGRHLAAPESGESLVLRALTTESLTKAELRRRLEVKSKTQIDRWVDSLTANGLVLWDTHKQEKSRGIKITASMLGLQVILASTIGSLVIRNISQMKPEVLLQANERLSSVFTPALVRIEDQCLQVRSPFGVLESVRKESQDWNPRIGMTWLIENTEALVEATTNPIPDAALHSCRCSNGHAEIDRLIQIRDDWKQRSDGSALAALTTRKDLA